MNIVEILKEHFAEHMTEEVTKSIQTSFELAISEKVSAEKDKLEEALEAEYKIKFDKSVIDLEEKLNVYIDKANEELIDENMKNVESTAKVELAEKLVEGILTTIKENNLEIAIEDKDIIKQLEEEKVQIEKSLNDSVDKIVESDKEKFELEKAIAVLTMTESLTDVDTEKVIAMVEHVEVGDVEDFKSKLQTSIDIISETKDKDEKTETFEENFKTKKDDSEMSQYLPTWAKE